MVFLTIVFIIVLVVVYIASVPISIDWLDRKGCKGTALEWVICFTPFLNSYLSYLSVFKSKDAFTAGITFKKLLEV